MAKSHSQAQIPKFLMHIIIFFFSFYIYKAQFLSFEPKQLIHSLFALIRAHMDIYEANWRLIVRLCALGKGHLFVILQWVELKFLSMHDTDTHIYSSLTNVCIFFFLPSLASSFRFSYSLYTTKRKGDILYGTEAWPKNLCLKCN